MSHTTLAGLPVLSGTVTLPRQGVWHADLVLEAPAPPVGPVVLAVGASLTLAGVALPATVFAGQVRVRVVGGAGRLRTELPPRWYQGAPRRLPLGDLCDEAGERLSLTSDAGLLDEVLLPGWTRLAGTAADALARLLEGTGASWRILPDGQLWVGPETWRPAAGMADLVVLDEDRSRGRLLLATEAPQLLPGQTIRGERVSDVILTIEPEAIRLEALLERDVPGVASRLGGALLALLEAAVRKKTDFLGWHNGTIVRTDAAGRLEVRLDDPRRPPLTGVRVQSGAPGLELVYRDGAQVQVSWEGGDPRRPIAQVWDPAGLDEVRVVAKTKVTVHAPEVVLDEETGRPVARLGDLVAVGGLGTLVIFSPVPPAPPTPLKPGEPYLMTFATPTSVPGPQLYGTILTANARVKGLLQVDDLLAVTLRAHQLPPATTPLEHAIDHRDVVLFCPGLREGVGARGGR